VTTYEKKSSHNNQRVVQNWKDNPSGRDGEMGARELRVGLSRKDFFGVWEQGNKNEKSGSARTAGTLSAFEKIPPRITYGHEK